MSQSLKSHLDFDQELDDPSFAEDYRGTIPHRKFVEQLPPEQPTEPGLSESKSLLSERTSMYLMLASVVFLIVQLVQIEEPIGLDLVELLDITICGALFVDFVYSLIMSKDRWTFLKSRWWEPFATIPMIDAGNHSFFAFRVLRIMRIMRIVRLHKEVRNYMKRGNDFLQKNKVLDISSIVLMTILGGSLGFFYAEQGVNPNLKSYSDSVWWALVTVTTIGYGDIYPVTTAGRFVASLMMIIGIGCVSALTGMIAANVMRDNKCSHCGKDL